MTKEQLQIQNLEQAIKIDELTKQLSEENQVIIHFLQQLEKLHRENLAVVPPKIAEEIVERARRKFDLSDDVAIESAKATLEKLKSKPNMLN